MSERYKVPVSVHLFLRQNNQLLLLRRYNTGYEDGKYSVIAGHIDGNETVYEAIIREAYEEAGISLSKSDLEAVQVMHRKKQNGEYIDYFFTADQWGGELVNNEPDKCDDLRWYDIDALPENMIRYVSVAIDNYLSGKTITVFGWE